DTSCSCPDYANPCKHVAAVHYVLAQTFDADPFLLPTLRGRDQTALRTCKPAASHELAEALDLDVAEVRAHLAKLITDGTVTRTGHTRTTCYQTSPICPR
ncbi:MAG: SWIM zinc finger family protein, partial [Egibacteraceae bacterium]